MKTPKIFRYFKGYLTLCADGPFCERLLNICMHRSMPIWDIKYLGNSRVIFKTDIASFLKIRTPARRTRSRIKILKRHGLRFILHRYRKRRWLALGLIPLLVFLWYTSTHVVGITIFGNVRIETTAIMSALNECGLSVGTRTSSISPDSIRNNMMRKLDELAWIGVNANGGRVYIEVVERLEKDKGIEKDGIACNLVASKDGEIEHLEIREGQQLVKIGSGVCAGDVLVSGIVDDANNGFRFVKARGEVFARTKNNISRFFEIENSNPSETAQLRGNELINELKGSCSEETEILSENYSYTITEHNQIEVFAEIICRENIAKESIIEKALTE